MTSYYQTGPLPLDTRTEKTSYYQNGSSIDPRTDKTNTTLYSPNQSSSSSTLEPSAVYYALGVALLIIGISSLVIFHWSTISACIVIALGAEIMKAANRDVEEFNNRGCGSLYGTAIAAIVLSSMELVLTISFSGTILGVRGDNSYRYSTYYYNCNQCSCNFDYSIKESGISFFVTDAFLYYNFGATLFDSIIKISFCSLFLHISKKRRSKHSQSQGHGQGQSQGQGSNRLLEYTHSQRFIQPNQPTLLDTGSVLYSLGVLMLSLGIITLVIVNFGFISSCILIVIGDMWMKAIKNQTDNMSLTERRGLFSLNSLAITGIVLTSLEFVISIILLAFAYTQKSPPTSSNSPYYCPYATCSCDVMLSMYEFADFCSYNLGVSLITTVTKIILFWFTLHLTKTSSTSFGDDIYEQEITNNNKVKEGTALLASTTNTTTTTSTTTPSQTRIGTTTALIGVRNNTL
jgi:hypothetical protein